MGELDCRFMILIFSILADEIGVGLCDIPVPLSLVLSQNDDYYRPYSRK